MGNITSKDVIDGECLLKRFDPDHYKKVGNLGRGGFSHVDKLARVKEKNGLPLEVARKIIQITTPTEDELREYKILRECNHENILKLFYWKIVDVKDLPKHLYLYTELCDYNLRKFVGERKLDSHALKDICRQMNLGCSYLHSQSVVHRDIKPENILIVEAETKRVTVRIADFGFARMVQRESIESSFQYSTKLTRHYASPEMMRAYNDRSHLALPRSKFATDIFSLGVVMFEMFTGELPFTIRNLGKPTFDSEKVVRDNIDGLKLVKCLTLMLQWNPKLRPESKELLKFFPCPWQSVDVVQVKRTISTLHHLHEAHVLVIGCYGGSIFTVNDEGKQSECVQKHSTGIECIRHHDNIVVVAARSSRSSLWRWSGEIGDRLLFLGYLLDERRTCVSVPWSSVDISEKYVAWGSGEDADGNFSSGELVVWGRATTEGDFTTVKLAEEKFEEGLRNILLHESHVLCGMRNGHFLVYDPEKRVVIHKLKLGKSPVCSITKSADRIYLATLRDGIFFVDHQYELERVFATTKTFPVAMQQIAAVGGGLYCLLGNGQLKSFSLSPRPLKGEGVPLDYWEECGSVIVRGGEGSSSGLYTDKFQIFYSTLFIVFPRDGKRVKVIRLFQDK